MNWLQVVFFKLPTEKNYAWSFNLKFLGKQPKAAIAMITELIVHWIQSSEDAQSKIVYGQNSTENCTMHSSNKIV